MRGSLRRLVAGLLLALSTFTIANPLVADCQDICHPLAQAMWETGLYTFREVEDFFLGCMIRCLYY